VRYGATLALVALTAVLTACGTGSPGGDKGGGTTAAGPPSGGWPQPENGRLTTRMCGLLTDADYAKYGHRRLPVVSQENAKTLPNAIDCLYTAQDDLSLSLQPTAEAARLQYSRTLADHKDRLSGEHRPSALATDVVPGADESWFDYWTLGTADSKFKEYQLSARRGALVVGIVLSGLKGDHEQDPRTVLSGLAGLVLQRIPDVGRTDTGTTSKARFTVVGGGRAHQIIYTDPTTLKSVTLKNVKLPWHLDTPLVDTGQGSTLFNLTAQSGVPTGMVGCSVSVGGATMVEEQPRMGVVSCMETYTPRK
jgi:hypothetical protein